ncbi:MAG: hypothetical protein WBD75_00830 [Phycisphaerae bacterium]
MIRLSEEATEQAFEAFCSGRQKWVHDIGFQLKMYQAATKAFQGDGSLPDFNTVYKGLRKWKVFRAGSVQAPEVIHANLMASDQDMRGKRLSELGPEEWPSVWKVMLRLKDVKQIKRGPSLMAISKFLHFWNPRLFIIFDREAVEQGVFGRKLFLNHLPKAGMVTLQYGIGTGAHPRLGKYLRALVFASEFVKCNPGVLPEFARTVRALGVEGDVPADIETYEATAVEWCLIGLAEMPPSGVEVLGERT